MKEQYATLKVKAIYCLLTAMALSIITYLDILQDHLALAAVAGSFAALLIINALYTHYWAHPQNNNYLEWFLASCLMIFTLVGTHNKPAQVAQWLYLVPLYLFLLVEYRYAKPLASIYSLAICLVIILFFQSEIKMQILTTYILCASLSFAFAVLNERRNQRLAPLISLDPMTGAGSQLQLQRNLSKELLRAEREFSVLSLIRIQILKTTGVSKKAGLGQLSSHIRQQLRPFDNYYLTPGDDFILVLPHSESEEVEARSDILLETFNLHLNQKIKIACITQQLGETGSNLLTRLDDTLQKAAAQQVEVG